MTPISVLDSTGGRGNGIIPAMGALEGLKAAVKKLRADLEELERQLREDIPEEIATARAHGDLRENAEYQAALENQKMVQSRVGDLRKRVSALAAVDISRIPKDRISYGSKVELYDVDSDEDLVIILVSQEEADPKSNLYSVESPVGKALLGRQDGDEVMVVTPGGKRHFEITLFTSIHEREE